MLQCHEQQTNNYFLKPQIQEFSKRENLKSGYEGKKQGMGEGTAIIPLPS